MALNMEVESDEDVLDEEPGEDEESEGEDAAVEGRLATTHGGMEEEDEGELKVSEIDAYWLQRQINEYEKNPEKSALITEQVLGILQSDDEVGVGVSCER